MRYDDYLSVKRIRTYYHRNINPTGDDNQFLDWIARALHDLADALEIKLNAGSEPLTPQP
jgi:hypothetical protein